MLICVDQPEHDRLDDGEDRRGCASLRLAGRRDPRRQSRRSVRRASRAISTRRFPCRACSTRSPRPPDADAFVVACFDDTGLEAARSATAAPVVGIGEAAFHLASLIAEKFSVVTTLPRSIAPIEKNLVKYGLMARCARVRAADVPVLALEEPGSAARQTIEAEILRALAEDGAEAIVLGCAGMTDLARDLEQKAGVPVLDGVACAVGLAETLARLGLRTSKRNAYAFPLAKDLCGRRSPGSRRAERAA